MPGTRREYRCAPESELATEEQMAAILGVSPRFMRKRREDGTPLVPYVDFGKNIIRYDKVIARECWRKLMQAEEAQQ